MKKYYVYIVGCADSTYYTGICTDLTRRVHEHNTSSRGAQYTKTRRPVTLLYEEICTSRSEALKREYAIKHLSRAEKQSLWQQ